MQCSWALQVQKQFIGANTHNFHPSLLRVQVCISNIEIKRNFGLHILFLISRLKCLTSKTSIHSKNTRVSVTRERVHWGQTPFRGSAWHGKGSIGAKLHSGSMMTRKSVNLTRNMTQSWVNLTPFVSLTDFREWSLAPMETFPGRPGHGWPGCF